MIPGTEIRTIEKYAFIDRMSEGLGWVHPKDEESFVGIPCGYYEGFDGSFIEVWKGDKLIRMFQVEKMRGLAVDNQPRPYNITNDGVEIYHTLTVFT